MARTYRFFIRNASTANIVLEEKSFVIEEKMETEIFFQLMKVLRCKNGDGIVLIAPDHNSDFFEYRYEVKDTRKKEIELLFCEKIRNDHELPFELNLVVCLPNKPEKLEFILQKSVELGIKKITVCHGDFSQMKHQIRPERLTKIMREAAEQAERAYVPTLVVEGSLVNFLECQGEKTASFFVAMERREQYSLSLDQAVKNTLSAGQNVIHIVIGPEGGFSPGEKTVFSSLNLYCFSLGKRILRMETAAIVSLGIVSNIELGTEKSR